VALWLGAAMLCLAGWLSLPHALRAQPAEHPPDTMAARVLACAPCHGPQGQGTSKDYFPRLAGKPAGYLMNPLLAFREGRRRYPPMNYLLEFLPDSYLQRMAAYFAAQRPPAAAPAVPAATIQDSAPTLAKRTRRMTNPP